MFLKHQNGFSPLSARAMALLTRYFQLGDADGTEVLNFIVTKAVTRDLKRDVISKDFVFGFHRWALSFSREEKVRECVTIESPKTRARTVSRFDRFSFFVGFFVSFFFCHPWRPGA